MQKNKSAFLEKIFLKLFIITFIITLYTIMRLEGILGIYSYKFIIIQESKHKKKSDVI